MKTYALVAFILIAVGIVAFAYHGLTSPTDEKVAAAGASQMTATKTGPLPLLPTGAALAILGGIFMLIIGEKKTDGLQYLSTRRRLP